MQARFLSGKGTLRQNSKSRAHRFLIVLLVGLFAVCGAALGGAPAAALETGGGSVQVFLAPPEAVAAGAQWRLDGTDAWHASGETIADVSVDMRSVVFRLVPGWHQPMPQPVQVVHGQTTVMTGTYVPVLPPAFGSVQVTIYPADAVTSGAQWRVDDMRVEPMGDHPALDWHNSGDTVANVLVGMHGVIFKEIAGWQQPRPLSVPVLENQTTVTSGTYVQAQPPAFGSLQVTITPPEAVAAGAKWWVDAYPGSMMPIVLHASGDTVTVPAGMHPVFFIEVAGWQHPEPLPVQILPNQTTVATGVYVPAQPPAFGSVTVAIFPADAVTSGAQWRVDDMRVEPMGDHPVLDWHNSGDTVANVLVGMHGVIFKEIAGWQQPRHLQVEVVENQTAVTSGSYVPAQPPAFGSVTVAIFPADAVTSGAQWRVDNMWEEHMRTPVLIWHNSGETMANIPVGRRYVVFKPLPGWLAPMPVAVQVVENQTAVTSGTYVVRTTERGALQVAILPQAAADAGARWRRAGSPAWHASGDTETGVPAGLCTVEFSPLQGWMRPGEQQVMILPGQTAQCQGEYVQGTTRIAPPTHVAASDGTFADHVEVTWAAGTTVTTHFQVYRANAAFDARQAISGWQTDVLFEDTTATPDTTYFYWVKGASDASGAAASEFSRPDAGWCGVTSDTLSNYQAIGTGCTITMPDSTHMTVQVTTGTAPCSVKIVRLRHLPPMGGGGTGMKAPRAALTMPGNAGLDQVQVNGDVVRFYTDAPIRELDVTGSLQMLTTRAANVENLAVAGSIGVVRMLCQTSGTTATLPYATTRIQSGAAGNSGLTILLNGIILEALDTPQNVNVLGVSSKMLRGGPMVRALRRRAGAAEAAVGGIGRITEAAQADTVGEYKMHAASFGAILVRGGSIVADKVLADSGTIQQIVAMGGRPGGAPIGGVIGNASDPTTCRLLAPNFGSIFGGAGVHAVIVAGYDATQASDYSGSVAVIGTRSGTLSGEVDLSPTAAASLRLLPSAGDMVVVTAP